MAAPDRTVSQTQRSQGPRRHSSTGIIDHLRSEVGPDRADQPDLNAAGALGFPNQRPLSA
jgi:hypothetical protein